MLPFSRQRQVLDRPGFVRICGSERENQTELLLSWQAFSLKVISQLDSLFRPRMRLVVNLQHMLHR